MTCFRCTEQRQFILRLNVTQWFLGCTFQPILHKFTELTLTDLFHCVSVHIAYLFMTTFASRVSMSPLSSMNGFPMSSNVANRVYYRIVYSCPFLYFLSQCIFELCQFSDFHCGNFFNSRWRPDTMSVVVVVSLI